jgi:predicted ATP-dependent endonuclease of OLD family
MHALVGANNSGKSAVLRALDFLFNPSVRNLNEESFWCKDTTLEIRVEAVFSDLTDEEKEALKGYIKPDGTFHIARSARMGTKSDEDASESDQDIDKITIGLDSHKFYVGLTPLYSCAHIRFLACFDVYLVGRFVGEE